MKITAAVVERRGAPFVLQELDLGELRDDEVLVRSSASGICHTDLICRDSWYPVPLPAVLGHEGAGVIEAVGRGVTRFALGDRVAMSFDSCGTCPTCTQVARRLLPHVLRAQLRRVAARGRLERPFARRRARSTRTSSASRASRRSRSRASGTSSRSTTRFPFEIAAPFGCGIQTGRGLRAQRLAPARRQQHRGLRSGRRRSVRGDGREDRRLHDDHRGRHPPEPARARAGGGRDRTSSTR